MEYKIYSNPGVIEYDFKSRNNATYTDQLSPKLPKIPSLSFIKYLKDK